MNSTVVIHIDQKEKEKKTNEKNWLMKMNNQFD